MKKTKTIIIAGLILLFLGWTILSSIEEHLPVSFEKKPTYAEEVSYLQGLYNTYNSAYTGALIPSGKNLRLLKRKITATSEYLWDNYSESYRTDYEKYLTLLDTLIYGYSNFGIRSPRLEYYLKEFKSTIDAHRKDLGELRYIWKWKYWVEISAQVAIANKQYQKAIDLIKQIPENMKYEDENPYNLIDNTWRNAYKWIAEIYAYKLKDYDKAIEYARKMDIDPRKLPKEKIGELKQLQYQTYDALSFSNHDVAYSLMYYISNNMNKHKEAQIVLVEYLNSEVARLGFIVEGDHLFRALIEQRKAHRKLIPFRPTFINSGIPPKGQKYNIVPFSQYLEEQKKLYEQGKPSNYKWL
jgi:hypothetical protein